MKFRFYPRIFTPSSLIAIIFFLLGASISHILFAERGNTNLDIYGKFKFAQQSKVSTDSSAIVFSVETSALSYFDRDSNGALIPEIRNSKKYFKINEKEFFYKRILNSKNTAMIIMDPWEDNGSTFIDNKNSVVMSEGVLPLIGKGLELKLPIFVLTNGPSNNYDYSNKVHPKIEKMHKEGRLKILHHEDFSSDTFADFLKIQGINSLIYAGFSSNMCVIGRALGMIPMQIQGFKLFFVPEASNAVEFGESWNTGELQKATTTIISQWIAEIIHLKNFLNVRYESVDLSMRS